MSSQRYEVIGKIGQGGLGEVYLAKDTQLDREVALKRMKPPEDGNVEALAADLMREAKTLSSLQHPNIVTVFDVGKDATGPYVVLEYLKGETLDAVIERGGMTYEDFHQVVVQTLEGLIAAQSLGLVHRDLKPGNLMVIWLASGKFQLKILDFGLAKFSQKAKAQTQDQEGGIFGSIYFMAPEQFERLPLDARTDMYSLGCIYYQILTTKHPFSGETAVEVMASHLQHHVAHVKQLRPDLPDWVCHWVMWLISREMDDRPPDARTALQFFLAKQHGLKDVPAPAAVAPVVTRPGVRPPGPPGSVTRPIVPGQPGAHATHAAQAQGRAGTMATARSSTSVVQRMPSGNKRPMLWLALASLALALVGGAGWFFFLREDPDKVLNDLRAMSQPAGDAKTVATLAKIVRAGGTNSRIAADVLGRLQGNGVPEAILKEAQSTSSGSQKVMFLEALGERKASGAAPFLVKLVGDSSSAGAIREAGLRVLPKQVEAKDFADLVKLAEKLKNEAPKVMPSLDAALGLMKDGAARINALAAAAREATPAVRLPLLRLLGALDPVEAVKLVEADLLSRKPELVDGALNALEYLPPTESLMTTLRRLIDENNTKAAAAYCNVAPRVGISSSRRSKLLEDVETTAGKLAPAEFKRALGMIANSKTRDMAKKLGDTEVAARIEQMLARTHNLNKVTQSAILPASGCEIVTTATGDAAYNAQTQAVVGWKDPATRLAWDVEIPSAGIYGVGVKQASTNTTPRSFRVILGSASPALSVPTAKSATDLQTIDAGGFTVPTGGRHRLWIEAVQLEKGQEMMAVFEVSIQKK